MTKIPKDQIDAYKFSRENDFGIEVEDQFYGKKSGFLDNKDPAKITETTEFEGRTYQAGSELPWNDPLYVHARELYLERNGGPDKISMGRFQSTSPVQATPERVVDRNAEAISNHFCLVDSNDNVEIIPTDYQFQVGDAISFNLGRGRQGLFIISGPEPGFTLNIQATNDEGQGIGPTQGRDGLYLYKWAFEKSGTYEIRYTISSAPGAFQGKIQEGSVRIEVSE